MLTNGGRFNDQRKAIKLEKFVYSEMRALKVWDVAPLIFRDGCIFGTGVMKVFARDGRVHFERTLISNLLVDERQALEGNPREIHERRLIDRDVLKAMFPGNDEAIDLASARTEWLDESIPTNQVLVIETHRLPDGKNPGRHTICIEHACLLDEKRSESYFPYVFFRWDGLPISGFYGLGLARDLHGFQQRINQMNVFIQRCQDLIAVPRVFVDMASKVLKVQINNKIGAIIPYRGKPPTFYTPNALNAEIYNYKEQLKRSAFEFAGISQLSAQSLKPAGLESAVALREYNDIETNRFVIQAQRYERMYLDLAEMFIRVQKTIKNPKPAKYQDRNCIQQIEWADVDLERDRFSLDIQAASLLSMSPSARLQAVTELAQVGQLDKSEIRHLLNHPDLEASNDLATADFRDIQRLEQQLLDGEYRPPEPFQNLDLGMQRIQLLLLHVQNEYEDVPEEVLQNMRDWISQAKTLQEQAVQAGVPGQPADPAAATGQQPLAGGVAGSDVIQNLPGQIANV